MSALDAPDNAEALLDLEVSDNALEAAGQPPAGPAFSFANAPTVSIVFSCCGNGGPSSSPER